MTDSTRKESEPLLQAVSPQLDEQCDHVSKIKLWPQVMVTLSSTLGGFIMGTSVGWTGPALPFYEKSFVITLLESSLIGSSLNLGALIGGLASSYAIIRYRRRSLMLFLAFLYALSYFIMLTSFSCELLVIGRFCCGFATGIVSVCVPLYVSECASSDIRGSFGSCFQLMVTLGILFVNIVAAVFLSWRWICTCCLLVTFIWILLVIYIPDSPNSAAIHGCIAEAKNSLYFLRQPLSAAFLINGNKESFYAQIDSELDSIVRSTSTMNESLSWADSLARLKSSKRLIFASLILMIGQQISGINVIIFYSVNIFKAAGASLSPFLQSIIVSLVMVFGTILSIYAVDRFGRKILLFISSIVMCISMFILGLFFRFPDKMFHVVPLLCLNSFVFSFSLGYGPLPWLMMSEILPCDIRAMASSLATASNWFLAFLVTQLFPIFVAQFGNFITFWMFGCALILLIIASHFGVPETKGLSVQEI